MLAEPKCYTRGCRHFAGVRQDRRAEATERVVCPAFPDGIPDEVAYGSDPHLRPREGQGNDVAFEPEAR